MLTKRSMVVIYTDGACLGNPGPGGFAALIIHGDHRVELTGGCRLTTNNRMEITAAITGLQALNKRSLVRIYTDSKYLAESISQGWAISWQSKRWKKGDGKRLNWDLWEKLLDLCEQHQVEFMWVQGHAGDINNERCDVLSVEASKMDGLPVDAGYEVAMPSQLELQCCFGV